LKVFQNIYPSKSTEINSILVAQSIPLMSAKILLVDDEPDILDFLSYNLEKAGYQVFLAENGEEGLIQAKKNKPHLILLDVMMPEMDGIQACKEIRKISFLKDVIIAFLTARSEDFSQISGLDAGADDYITKPIKPSLLLSRVKALLRRSTDNKQPTGLTIDEDKYLVFKDGNEIVLPKKEFELFALLYSAPETVHTREAILEKVWGTDVIVGDRTIDVHIRKLRAKIGDDHIVTVKGVGYKLLLK